MLIDRLTLGYKYYIAPCYHGEPVKQEDFPQHFIDVDLSLYREELMSFHTFQTYTLDIVEHQEHILPIMRMVWQGEKHHKKLLIFAGVHGNETGGLLAIPKLLTDIQHFSERYEQWEIRIITPVNPIGVLYQSRYNENGCDLNRKMFRSTQKGIVIQRNEIDEFDPDFIVTLHEAPSEGFLIHPSIHVSQPLIDKVLQDVSQQGVNLSIKDYWGRELPQHGCSRVSGMMRRLGNILRVESLDDWVEDREIPVITTESCWNSEDQFQRVDSHVYAVQSVIDSLDNMTN